MPVLSVVSAIQGLASGTYTVTRFGSGTYTNGAYVGGTSSTFDIVASIQPATGRELQRLPEGERVKDYLNIWTATSLRGLEGDMAPDRVSVDGYTYEVAMVDDWLTEGGFCKAIAQRLDA